MEQQKTHKDTTIYERMALVVEVIGITPAQLGKSLRVDYRRLKKTMAGESLPTYEMIHRLVHLYNVNAEWLIKGTGLIFSYDTKFNNTYGIFAIASKTVDLTKNIKPMMELIPLLKDWIGVAEKECKSHSQFTDREELFIGAKHYCNPKLTVGIKAVIAINDFETYTINSTLKIR